MQCGAASMTLELVDPAAASSNEEHFFLGNKYVYRLACSERESKIGFLIALFKLENRTQHHWCAACKAQRVSFAMPSCHPPPWILLICRGRPWCTSFSFQCAWFSFALWIFPLVSRIFPFHPWGPQVLNQRFVVVVTEGTIGHSRHIFLTEDSVYFIFLDRSSVYFLAIAHEPSSIFLNW